MTSKNQSCQGLLILAATSNAVYSARYLFEIGLANVNERDDLNRTALHHAALHDSIEYTNMTFSITGPKSSRLNSTKISHSGFAISSADSLTISNSTFDKVEWRALHVRDLVIQDNSYLDLTLNECETQDDTKPSRKPLEEEYCSDACLTISSNSNVSFYYERNFVDCPDLVCDLQQRHSSVDSINKTELGEILEEFHPSKEWVAGEGGKCLSAYSCFEDKDHDLRSAVRLNNIERMREILQVTSKNKSCQGLLILAATSNAFYSARYLFENGLVNVCERDDLNRTALHHAALHDSIEVAELLLKNSASVNATESEGHTPLHLAASKDCDKVAIVLLEMGAGINLADEAGKTPLHYAAQYDSSKVAKLLSYNNADTEATDEDGKTPLHWAARYDSLNVAELLLNNSADIDARTKRGWTALHYATWGKSHEVGELLINKKYQKTQGNAGKCLFKSINQ